MERLTAYFGRLVAIVLGFIASALAAGFFLAAMTVLPGEFTAGTQMFANIAVFTAGLILASLAGYYALLPATLAIAYAEWAGKRDWLLFALAGGVIGLGVALLRGHGAAGGIAPAITAAGLIGGIVYWLVAGRSSGTMLDRLGTPEA